MNIYAQIWQNEWIISIVNRVRSHFYCLAEFGSGSIACFMMEWMIFYI